MALSSVSETAAGAELWGVEMGIEPNQTEPKQLGFFPISSYECNGARVPRTHLISSRQRQNTAADAATADEGTIHQRRALAETGGLTLWRPLLPYGYSYKASFLCQTGLSRHL